ncbi:hypothetical protein [Lichenicoccus sp.]
MKRRRLVEVCLALALVFGVAAVLVGQGHQPLQLSGRLLAASTQ